MSSKLKKTVSNNKVNSTQSLKAGIMKIMQYAASVYVIALCVDFHYIWKENT